MQSDFYRTCKGSRVNIFISQKLYFGHKILDSQKSSSFYPTFPFLENNMKRTFFIQDLECGTIESDIFLPCLEYTFLLFFRNNTLEGYCIPRYYSSAESSSSFGEEKCKKKAITHTPFKEEDSRHKISNNNCSCQRTDSRAQCLKITQNVAFEFLNFGNFHHFLSY